MHFLLDRFRRGELRLTRIVHLAAVSHAVWLLDRIWSFSIARPSVGSGMSSMTPT